jgi:PAS domain-containing protein
VAKEPLHGVEEIVAVKDALRSAERSLVESGRWFEQLVANSKDLIAVIDEHGTLVYANSSSATLMGYEKNSKTGRTIFDLIHPDDHAVATAALAEIATRTSTSMSASEPVVIRILNSWNEWRFIEAELTNCLDDPAIRGVVTNGGRH